MQESFHDLVASVKTCELCARVLPNPPFPVFQVSRSARVLVVGQAPGQRVHDTGVPFNDPSGDRLRRWMGIDRHQFYDSSKVALLPMSFCFPGTGASGDLPPPAVCANTWRNRLLNHLSNVRLTLLCGGYAIRWHLTDSKNATLTSTVKRWREYDSSVVPLPHPSGRNNGWIKNNSWFEAELIPELRRRVNGALSDDS